MMTFWQANKTSEAFYWISMIPAGVGYGAIITISEKDIKYKILL